MGVVSGWANLCERVLLMLKVGFHDDMLPRFRKTARRSPLAFSGVAISAEFQRCNDLIKVLQVLDSGWFQMSDDLLLKAERRAKLGTVDTKRLRAAGRVPANIYGLGKPGASVSVCRETVEKLVSTRSSVVDVELDGQVDKAVVQELQWDVFSTSVQHVDLRRVDPSGRATVEVSLELRGEPVGLKDGGALRQLSKTVTIDCPDYRIPKSIVVRIGGLQIGDGVKASDLQVPEHAKLVTPAGTMLVELYDPRKAV